MNMTTMRRTIGLTLSCLMLVSGVLHAQDDAKQPAAKEKGPPKIADEPKTVDPATLVPKQLAAAVTVDFSDSSLREIVQWIQDEQKIVTLFDKGALSDAGIPLGEPITDHLTGDPLYLLLNRLSSLQLAWYVEDNILHITTAEMANDRMSTVPYNVGDLFDGGYKLANLEVTIHEGTSGLWEDIDGDGGSTEWLGDVLFVRQTEEIHRQIAGLLSALRKHGRQTFTLDPPQHMILRQKLGENVSVKFEDTPLITAIKELAEQTKADIRLDASALRDIGIRDREPVSLTLSDRKLSTVLHVLLSDLQLTWILRDGVLWITSEEQAAEHLKTAVYDVRDLCRDEQESNALTTAIQTQTAGLWEEIDGDGGTIVFARTGTMVIRQTEDVLGEIRELLANYRKALLISKPRKRDETDDNEVVTRYYRMHESIADDLVTILPRLVQPETWRSDQKPAATGYVLKVASGPELLDAQGHPVHSAEKDDDKSKTHALVVSQAVLIIRHTRAAHKEIAKVIGRVSQGDPPEAVPGAFSSGGPRGAGLGGGGGGFGGSFFSTR